MCGNKKKLNVINASNITIKELVHKLSEGYMLYRTSHIGNHYYSNILLDLLGVTCSLFDRNQTEKDINYYPQHVIADGKCYRVAINEVSLVPFIEFDLEVYKKCPYVNGEKNPMQVHFNSLKNVYNNFQIESEFLLSEEELFRELLEKLLYHDPDAFTKIVNKTGKTWFLDKPPQNAVQMVIDLHKSIVDQTQSRDINWFKEGVGIKVELAILITTIIGVVKSGKSDVYEFSGPDMIKYVLRPNFMRKLKDLYALIGKDLTWLPDELNLHVVPSFFFRFGALESEKDSINELLSNLIQYRNLNFEKRQLIKDWKKAKKQKQEVDLEEGCKIGSKFNPELSKLSKLIHGNTLISRVTFQLSDKSFYTQYDVINSGEKLCLAEEVENLTMKDHQELFEIIEVSKNYL